MIQKFKIKRKSSFSFLKKIFFLKKKMEDISRPIPSKARGPSQKIERVISQPIHVRNDTYGNLLDQLYDLDNSVYGKVFSNKQFIFEGDLKSKLELSKLRKECRLAYKKLSDESKEELDVDFTQDNGQFWNLTKLLQILKARSEEKKLKKAPIKKSSTSKLTTFGAEINSEEEERERRGGDSNSKEYTLYYVDRKRVQNELTFVGIPTLTTLQEAIVRIEANTFDVRGGRPKNPKWNREEDSIERSTFERQKNYDNLYRPSFRVLHLEWYPYDDQRNNKEEGGKETEFLRMNREKIPSFLETKVGYDLFFPSSSSSSFDAKTKSNKITKREDLIEAFFSSSGSKKGGNALLQKESSRALRLEALIQYEIDVYERVRRRIVETYYFTQGNKNMSLMDFEYLTLEIFKKEYPNLDDVDFDILYQIDRTRRATFSSFRASLKLIRAFNYVSTDRTVVPFVIQYSDKEFFEEDDLNYPYYLDKQNKPRWRFFYVNTHSNFDNIESSRRSEWFVNQKNVSLDEQDFVLLYGTKNKFLESSYLLSRWYYHVSPSILSLGLYSIDTREKPPQEQKYLYGRDVEIDVDKKNNERWIERMGEPNSFGGYWQTSFSNYWTYFEEISKGPQSFEEYKKAYKKREGKDYNVKFERFAQEMVEQFNLAYPCLPVGTILFEGQGYCTRYSEYECDFYRMIEEVEENSNVKDLVGSEIVRNRVTSTTWNYNVAIKKFSMNKVLIVMRIDSDDVKGFPREIYSAEFEDEITLVNNVTLTIERIDKNVQFKHIMSPPEGRHNVYGGDKEQMNYVVYVSVKKYYPPPSSIPDMLRESSTRYLPESMKRLLDSGEKTNDIQDESRMQIVDREEEDKAWSNEIFRTHEKLRLMVNSGLKLYFYNLTDIKYKPDLILTWILTSNNSFLWGYRISDLTQLFREEAEKKLVLDVDHLLSSDSLVFYDENNRKIETDRDLNEYCVKSNKRTFYYTISD